MRVHLLQHGEATDKEVDPERPLTDAGHRSVARVARLCGAAGVRVERVVHSGKARARESAEAFAPEVGAGAAEAVEGLGPNDPVGPWVERLGSASGDVLIAGHMPFVARLVSALVTGREQPAIVAFKPATVVCVESDDGNAWAIAWMIRPELAGE